MELREYQIVHDKFLHPVLRCNHKYKWDGNSLLTYEEIYDMMCSSFHMDILNEEYTYVIAFNIQSELLGVFNISHGEIGKSAVNIQILFTFLILTGAYKFILVHNHPSGSLEISLEDINLTNSISRVCNFIDIKMEEHMIISSKGYSLAKAKEKYPFDQ